MWLLYFYGHLDFLCHVYERDPEPTTLERELDRIRAAGLASLAGDRHSPGRVTEIDPLSTYRSSSAI